MRIWGKKKRTENRMKNKRKKQGAGPQRSYLDHSVGSFDPHGSYGGPILKLPRPQGEEFMTDSFIFKFITIFRFLFFSMDRFHLSL